jgi:hypothetical protein
MYRLLRERTAAENIGGTKNRPRSVKLRGRLRKVDWC